MKIIKNNKVEIEKWHKLLKISEHQNPFQTPEFYLLFNETDGYLTEVFAVEDEDVYKSLVVVTIQKEKGLKGLFSLRGIVYGGPILLTSEEMYLGILLKSLRSYYRSKLIYLEIRNGSDYSSMLNIFQDNGWQYEPHLNVQLNLVGKNIDDLMAGMKYNRRREIRLSLKEGVETRLAKDEEEVVLLYNILNEMYKERVKLPLSSLTFFLNIFKSDIGKVFLVLHNNTIIGGAFCFFYKDMSINTLYYTGMRTYHKKIFPTHMAILGVIEFALKNNLKIVDFMGAGKPGTDYGVKDYKLQFGGDLVEHGRYTNIFKPRLFKIGIIGLKILSKIK